MLHRHLSAAIAFLLVAASVQAQKLPKFMRLDPYAHTLFTGNQASTGLYDESRMDTFRLWFSQPDYWQQLKNNYTSKTDLPATLVVNGDTFPNVGVRFKGNTSYQGTQNSDKKSFNITLNYLNPDQNLDGYETLNLNNAFQDASFMREVAYLHQIRRHIPAAQGNFVKLFINGQNWGIYPNVQQVDGELVKDWYFSNNGTRWRADRPPGSSGGPGMGGGWGDGTAGLNYLGADSTEYKKYYTLKRTEKTEPWGDLIKVCQVLNQTPIANLDTALARVMDVDRTLWFLASEIAFSDDDSYVYKGKMDYYLYWDPETSRMTPLEFDGNSVMKSNATNWSAFYNETKTNYPLLNRLLAAPHARQRYLAHLRTLIADEMNSTQFNALIDQYDKLISAEVQADPKKMTTFAQYGTEKQTLKNFVQNHRNTLLNHAEVKVVPPTISSATMRTQGGEWANPIADEAANITAAVSSPSGIAAVTAYYCPALYGTFQKVQMYDDGQHNDGTSGDGTYGAALPGFPTGTWVRFYVEAKAANTAGTLAFLPEGAEHDVYYYQVSSKLAENRPVVINEIMASNQNSATDEKGQHEDWIELYNLTDEAVDLSGWFLTDDPSKPDKWAFESGTTIGPKDYLIVWADEDGQQGPLHANFKLSASGEAIYLLNLTRQYVDTLTFGQQQTDKGLARVPNGTGPFVIQNPTFKANNGGSSPTYEPNLGEIASILAHPNPTRQSLRVTLIGGTYDTPLVVSDISGKMLHTIQSQSQQDLDVSAWSPGMYFLRWGSVVRKVVVSP